MKTTRRTLLKAGAAAVGCAALPIALTAEAERMGSRKNLIIVMNYGGWDPAYCLDPKPPGGNVDMPAEGTIQRFSELPILTDPSRPAVEDFFTVWGSSAAVVNGIQVRSFVHTDCAKRMLTGGPSEVAPDFGAIAAYELARDLPVPYLALGAYSRSGPLGSITGRAGTTNQITALIDPQAAYPNVRGALEPGLDVSDEERGFVETFLNAQAERQESTRGSLGYNRNRIQDFRDSLVRAERLKDFVRSGAGFGDRNYTLDLAVQAPLAVQAIADGLSQVAYIELNDWDTHENNSLQSPKLQQLYTGLSALMDDLDGRGLLDQTMVAVISEMGRTPLVNGTGGKDHWPITSAMLLGAGIDGGKVFGGTDDGLNALAVDLHTGVTGPDGTQLQTANFLTGVLRSVGVDPSAYMDAEPFDAFCAS